MKDIATKINGTSTYDANEFNPNMTELENAVTSSGIVLDPTGTLLTQLSESMGRYGGGGGDFYDESGAANAYVLTPVSPFVTSKVYFDGMRVVFIAGNDSTDIGASTINVNTIGSVDLKDSLGNAIGDKFITANETFTAIFNASAAEFRIISSSRVIPFGLISLFFGAIANIPTAWQLCDGTNGTPDLRNNFVRGAGSTFVPDETGGSETTGSHTLIVAEMPAHTHGITGAISGNNDSGTSAGARALATNTSITGGGGGHMHPDTVPPFYALAYIMKL